MTTLATVKYQIAPGAVMRNGMNRIGCVDSFVRKT